MDLSKLNDSDYEAFKAGRLSDMSDAGYEYVKSQRSANIPSSQEPQEELSTMDKITRALNFEGGLGRGALATAIEPLVGKELVTGKQITSGTVPSSEELAKKAGVDLTYMYPAFARNLAKLTGQEGKLQTLAGATADVYLAPSTALTPMLQAAQIGSTGAKLVGAKFLEAMLNPAGTVVTQAGRPIVAGAKQVGKLGKVVAGNFAQFTPDEVTQYLKNYSAVKELTNLLEDKTNLDVAQEKALEVISKMRDTLKKSGLAADKEMTNLLEGKNIQFNLNKIKQMAEQLPKKEKNEVAAIISRTEKDLQAYRPFEPEFLSKTAEQRGVEGLTYPGKPAQMIAPTVSEVIPEQQSLFATELVKQPEFLMPPRTVQKVEGQITPSAAGYSEFFYPEQAKFSELLQEPLGLPARSASPEFATIPANEARRLKQIFQSEAGYGKSVPVQATGTPRYTEYADIANQLNEELRKEAQTKALDDYMRQGKVVQKALQQGEKAPLQFLKTKSEDVIAMLARAAKRTGDKEVFDLADQLSAARKMLGKGDYDDWVRTAGRGALQTINALESQNVLTKKMVDKLPPQIWLQMIQSQNKEQGQ